MSRFAKLFAANAIAAAGLCSAGIALSSSAAAEPAVPPVIPNVPGLNMIQQFATNPASMGAVLQTAATALNGASAIVGAPAPATLPVSPIEGAPGVAPLPGTAVTPATAPVGPGSTLVPLLTQFGIPANLINLGPSEMPFPIQIGDQLGISPAPQAAPVTGPIAPAPINPALINPALMAPAAPGGGFNPLPLLDALP